MQQEITRVALDAMGGDNAPGELVKGAVDAVNGRSDIKVLLVGQQDVVEKELKQYSYPKEQIEVVHAEEVIETAEPPVNAIRRKKDSSIVVGMKLVKEGQADAFVSAGSTGALLMGATFLVKRIRGVKRAALAPILPTATTPFMLLDAGANNDCRPEMLVQFAIMGSAYMQNVMHVDKPRVALLNVGAEETKGRELELESYVQLAQAPVNFIGNIEARELPAGAADVVVTDGFTGNVALKLYEGMGKFMAHQMKGNLFAGVAGKLAALLILPKIKALTKKMDYKAVGGAVMLGVQKPVIKAHGSSDGTAFFNAIRQAKDCVAGNVVQTIAENTGKPVKK